MLQPISWIYDSKEGYQRNGLARVGASVLYQSKENERAGLYVVRLYNHLNPFHFLRGGILIQSLIFKKKNSFVSINLRLILKLDGILISESEF